MLAFFALEAVLHKPFAHELLGQLLLRQSLLEALLITFFVEIAAGVGRVDFVHQHDLTVVAAELVLGVHEDKSVFGGYLLSAGKERQRILLNLFVLLLRNESAGDDLLTRDVLVVGANLGLGGWGDDRSGELLVLAHTVGQFDAADLADTGLVRTPSRTAEVAADNHLDGIALTTVTDGHHRVGSSEKPVGHDVTRGFQKLGCNLVQDLPFVRNAFGQNHIEGRDAVGGNHAKEVFTNKIHVTNLAVIDIGLTGKGEVGFC